MSEHFCKHCNEYLWSKSVHKCPPIWLCRFERDDGEDWREVRARSAELAAEKFVEDFDCENEYGILRQGDRCEEVVKVTDSSDDVVRFRITAESLPHYYAEQIEAA